MTTLERMLQAVFGSSKFESGHPPIDEEKINQCLTRLPYSLSKSQRAAIFRTLSTDISYIQGPPGTGKSFTISALALAASELGLKVLIASQKKPAVDIVHSKVTSLLGDCGCLFVSEDQLTKQRTKGMIDELINTALDQAGNSEERELISLAEKVDQMISERNEYARQIFDLESELRRFYDCNEAAHESRIALKEDFDLADLTIKRINALQGKTARVKATRLLKECRDIRDASRKIAGKTTIQSAVRLKILSKAVLRALDFDIKHYLKHHEEVLFKAVDYSAELSDAHDLRRSIESQPLEGRRNSFARVNKRLYPANPTESILSELLALRHSVRINRLLQGKPYRDALEAFQRRLRWVNPKRVRDANAKIDFDRLFETFPIVMGEIKSLNPYLPFKEESFDLLILDEASQVNLAEIFPVLHRAKRFCIVGDHKQLGIKAGGVIFINKVFEKLTWDKYFSSVAGYPVDFRSAYEKDLLVSQSSILDLIRNDLNPVTASPVQLNEHFRSLPMLAEFTSDEFYKTEGVDSGLRIMTALPDKKALNAFKDLPVSTLRESTSKVNLGEVEKGFELIESFAKGQPSALTQEVFNMPPLASKPITVGVISFMRDQVNYMLTEIQKRLTEDELERIDLMIGTPEEFQGNEKDVIILAPCIDPNQKRSKAFMEDSRRFNVATSRAKYFTYFVHGELPSNMILMQRMLAKMNQGNALIADSNIGFLPIGWTYKKSECDSEFELIVADVLEELIAREYPDRLVIYNQVHTCGFRLDFVLYDRTTRKAIGIEVDGKYHYLGDGSSYTDDHLERADCLRRAGWTIKHLPYWNWFEDGWIDSDSPAAEDLRNSIREHFGLRVVDQVPAPLCA